MELRKPTGPQLQGLIGNPDAYAVQGTDGVWTPVREKLTPAVIADHRGGARTIGTYIVKPPDQARTLVFDVDAETEEEATAMLKQLTKTLIDINRSAPMEQGTLKWMTEWSGRKGWHVWILAEDYMPAEVLYRLGRGIREEAGFPKMEVFPKQTHLDPDKVTRAGGTPLGNLVKLPGGIHQVTGQANDILGEFATWNPVSLLEHLASLYPEVQLRGRRDDTPATVEYPCVNCIQGGVTHHRNIHYFHLAIMLRRWSITSENILAILERANAASGDPLPQEELEKIVDNSMYSGPVCSQLDDDVHCGEQCILEKRGKGLHIRDGSLKWAAVGEKVVVTVESRTDNGRMIEVSHPDAVQGRVSLKEAGKVQDKDGSD